MSNINSILGVKLRRPLAVFDIESTGVNPRSDRIVEFAVTIIPVEGEPESHHFLINPQCHIPAEVTAIHGISNEDVKDCPPFGEIAAHIKELLQDCDFAGFGLVKFDIPILLEEFQRANMFFDSSEIMVYDALRIFHSKEPRDLTAALKFYCAEEHDSAHSALGDVEATIKVIGGQMQKYTDLPRSIEKLNDLCVQPKDSTWVDRAGRLKWVDGEIVINFGAKFIGRKLRELAETERKFLQWIITSDFSLETKEIVADALEGVFPEPPGTGA
ncbi:MAG: 3'-5' exonuclease [Lentisphaerae bacterium]|jgi:DNA polymerase-3 subunit epsilon|nr:3'-5' exonuclease [Lentisphaerota bacterium]